MKAELQGYLQQTFGIHEPYATNEINCDYSIGGQVHIRFDLGGELPNATVARVEQASQRALTLFRETFENVSDEIWVLIYEYQGDSLFNETPNYLAEQFPKLLFATFYNQLEVIDNGCSYTDESGAEIKSEIEARIIIGKVKVSEIQINNILTALANAEMGFEPAITQRIYFINPQTDRIFRMYDDRGCLIDSNSADSIRKLYIERSAWIVDYHRPEIDKYFQQP
ncbi:DUF3885 domain-containing protein [Hymenobacter sp. BT683]|uniref:DUF3885 domain-containing protein n=1 Tax=Hymenobacter jeongseonensis TaxID=2791027 RepID=A0ABS0INI1_9BACT|nr:DUF3885 domain-containing protein [Hymenobacter jeongseonensis]MBF9239935.1 DUF3885 domain-containing protein [Hymenobacter jeongseonensis]